MQLFFFTLLFSLALGHFTFIFTKTDFVIEYAKVLGLSRLFLVKEYLYWKNFQTGEFQGYHVFLREKYHNFFGKLVGCPFCLMTFISLWGAIYAWVWWAPLLGFAIASLASIVYLTENLLYKKNFE